MEERHALPDTDRLSVLAATIMLAYALLPFVKAPERSFDFTITGIAFAIRLDFATVVAILTAALAAAGTDWLLHGHPRLGNQRTIQHWLLPALTAWIIGVPLTSLEVGWQWWAVLSFGAMLLVLVLIAEYIAVDLQDVRHVPATMGLTAVSFALFLILAIAADAAGSRLYVLLPGIALAIFLVTLRTLYLRLEGRWCWSWALGITMIVTQVGAALHYWRISPLHFGIVALALGYSLTSIAGSLEEGRSWRTLWVEPMVMILALLLLGWRIGG